MSQSSFRRAAAAFLVASAACNAAQAYAAAPPAAELPFDVVITNGHVVDGTGSPWYTADVAIRDGHIAAIGQLGTAPAKRRIDATGYVVAPGFVDMLGQSEFTILVDPRLPSKIYQGITTEITGEGASPAPMTGHARRGSTTCLPSCRRGRMTAAPIKCLSASRIRRRVRG